MRTLMLGTRVIGERHPTYIVAEIGINHNGSLDIARSLIDAAANAKCDAVKFQKRTPELCVPPAQRDQLRDTPWGVMTYLYKIPSAALTDAALLRRTRQTGRPLILSTGMSTMPQIEAAVALLGTENLLITHATSTYPCPLPELNLRMIHTIRSRFDCPVGYSGHEVGLATTLAAVCLGASLIERHITLDRAMWGTDQAASVEPRGLERLVQYIRDIESAMGDGVKTVYESERAVMKKLRRTDQVTAPSSLDADILQRAS